MSTDINTWYHVALTSESNTVKLFINGIEKYSTVYVGSAIGPGPLYIGGASSEGSGYTYTKGYMEDVRFTVGESRYNGTFTPPTAPLGPYNAE